MEDKKRKREEGAEERRAKEAKIAANDDESEPDLWASLPNEMVLMILQPEDQGNDLQKISLFVYRFVCRRWRDLLPIPSSSRSDEDGNRVVVVPSALLRALPVWGSCRFFNGEERRGAYGAQELVKVLQQVDTLRF